MSLFSSSSRTTSSGTQTPTNPVPVTNSIIDFTRLISSLGNQNPQQYVTGPSNLQNAAFSMGAGIAQRYGIGVPQGGMPSMPQSFQQLPGQMFGAHGQAGVQPGAGGGGAPKALVNGGTRTGSPDGVVMGKPQYSAATGGTGATQGGSLNDRLGVTPSSSDTGYLQGWTPPAEVAAEFRRIQGRMGNPNERATYLNMFDTNGDQHVNENEYYNWWIQNHGIPEGWQGLPNPNGSQPTGGGSPSQPTPSVPGGGGQPPLAQPGVGYSPATMPNNPAQLYNTAAGMTQAAGMSGPNLAAMAGLGPANTYNAAGQAQTGTYNPAGQAAAQGYGVTDAGATGYDAVNAGSQGYTAAGAANVGGYNAQTAGSRGYTADTISDAQRVQISPTANASASRGIQFSQPYENRYTDQVVNTTLNNFDEYAGRQRAAEAAQAAGNNAFGGSRFGVQRAITEEQIARERASQESGLRFGAQDRAFALGMQDAGNATQVSMANAAAANQRSLSQAGMDMQRLMGNMDARNQAGAFGAAAANQASMFNADSANAASQFGASARNQAALDAVGRQDVASQFGAGAANTAALTNAASANQARAFGANATNTAALTNAGARNQAAAFGADAANRSALDFAGRTDASGALGANARNAAAMDAVGRRDQAGQFNAGSQNQFDLTRFGAANDMSRFNAGQADTALARQLAAGGQLGDLAGAMGNNERADLQMLSALGADERNINQQQATADLQLMQMMAQLYGTMPYGLFNGQATTGTQTTRSNPSILSTLGSAAMGLGSLGWNPFGNGNGG